PHGVQHVAAGLFAFGPLGGQACRGGGRLEGPDHQAVVGHGGAGHVEHGDLDQVVRHTFSYSPMRSAVCSAMAGPSVMPRPPGPVTTHTLSSGDVRHTSWCGSTHWL